MNEMLLGAPGGAPPGAVILDIDFSRQTLGDTNITSANTPIPFTKSGAGTASVVNDATKGLVMQFNGPMFSTPMVPALNLSHRDFTLEVVFKEANSISTKYLMATGDYPAAGNIVAGMLVQLNGGGGGTQAFITDAAGNFVRCGFNNDPSIWVTVVLKWNFATKTMTCQTNGGTVYTYSAPFGFGDGTQLSLGASYVRGPTASPFTGMVKSLKIHEGV